MLKNFQLTAIVREGVNTRLLRIPMHQELQETLAADWQVQLDTFLDGVEEIDFDSGYQPEGQEMFRLTDYPLPSWLAEETSQSVQNLNAISTNDELVESIKGLSAFTINSAGEELILFQNFSRSHVIRPGKSLFLRNDTYDTTSRPGLTLSERLSAVSVREKGKLLFRNFRNANTFLPLADFYEEASEQEIREVLSHKLISAENADALATDSNQWFRKRFAMLRDSGVLDNFSAKEIQAKGKGFEVEIRISKGKVVFPADKPSAKKLLQFLNEELFRGTITETLYETNSKRAAD